MSDEPTPPEGEANTPEPETEKTVPYERFDKVNKQAKEAKAERDQMRKDMAELKAQMEERETAGLPELERERRRAEQLEKRATDAEKKAEEAAQAVLTGQRERWVTVAAQASGFADPSDAAAFLNLGEIDDEKDAERAVKKLGEKKKHLLKAEEPQLPGRVLKDGKTDKQTPQSAAHNMSAEAQYVSDALAQFRKSRAAAQ